MGEVYRARDARLERDVARQDRPAGGGRQPRRAGPFRARNAGGGGAVAPQHPGDLRRRPKRQHGVRGAGAAGGPDAARAAGRRCAAAAQGRGHRRADRPRPGRGARQADRPPRPEAGERLRHRRRLGEDPGFRPRAADGQAVAARGGLRDDGAVHRAGRDPGHRGLHGAGTGPRRAERPPRGHLRPGLRALRDAHRPSPIPARHGRRDDDGDPERGSARPRQGRRRRRARRAADAAAVPGEAARGAVPVGTRSGVRAGIGDGDEQRVGARCVWQRRSARTEVRAYVRRSCGLRTTACWGSSLARRWWVSWRR